MKEALELATQQQQPAAEAPRPATRDPEVHLAAFRVGQDEMVIDIMRIREILRPVPVTPLPKAPLGVKGMINLRGSVIPIIDVRTRFGLPTVEGMRTQRVMVVLDRRRLWGLHVDAVMEVVRVPRSIIRPGTEIFTGDAAEVFSGVLEHKGRLLLMLNLARFIQRDESVPIPALLPPGGRP
ncbi:MAG: chemotaxis protein CheW [Myxococcota bacterium]